jgi:hypothetical protein
MRQTGAMMPVILPAVRPVWTAPRKAQISSTSRRLPSLARNKMQLDLKMGDCSTGPVYWSVWLFVIVRWPLRLIFDRLRKSTFKPFGRVDGRKFDALRLDDPREKNARPTVQIGSR